MGRGASASGAVEPAVARFDRWLATMRSPDGFGGPVVHWWRDCILFCGPAADWRYEGIMLGYLELLGRTGEARWLAKAQAAAADVLRAQLPDGSYRSSSFEQNPRPGGTPHEAAVDCGLLLLARTLRRRNEPWESYLHAAERNLLGYYVSRLWNEDEQRFRDDPHVSSFVPNKTATLLEALCLLADLCEREELLLRYVRPAADAIVAHQVQSPGDPLDGAIAQNTLGACRIEKYFPYYIARCIPGLLAAYERLGNERHLEAARRAFQFCWRWRDPDGAFPQVVYAGRRVNRYPRWVGAVGDMLRAADLLCRFGVDADTTATLDWLLSGQLASGGFATAQGFAATATQRLSEPPDARDLLPVCGWGDKAFRFLASRVRARVPTDVTTEAVVAPCRFHGMRGDFREDGATIEVRREGRAVYRWAKGTAWADAPVGGMSVRGAASRPAASAA